MPRAYRLGRRSTSVERTYQDMLRAARELVEAGPSSAVSLAAVARRAGVARATVYNRFRSRAGLLHALAPSRPKVAEDAGEATVRLRRYLDQACALWAVDPPLYRHLPAPPSQPDTEIERAIAEQLASEDALRPGCSLKEAEDVIAALASFATFDRLHKDGRRAPSAVADILMRLAGGILA